MEEENKEDNDEIKVTAKITRMTKFTSFEFFMVVSFVAVITLMIYFRYRAETNYKISISDIKENNYYKLLEIDPIYSKERIEEKYNETIKIYSCSENLTKYAKIYNILIDDEKRKAYDIVRFI